MQNLPLVSIITPSFNQRKYLEQTIQSVLAQDYPNIEYIIVDGGSTDGSQEIIHRYADQLAWWVSEPDNGQGDAINKGFQHASGEIIAWLNSDDIYLPSAVSQAVAILQKNKQLGMIYSDAITIDTDGNPLNILSFGDWGLLELMSYRIICQPAVFMRHDILNKTGLLDPSYHFLLDHHLWIRMARQAPIKHIPRQGAQGLWAAARHHPQAKNVAQASRFSDEIFRLLSWMETQPDLAAIIQEHENDVLAGAYRLSGRYLLDGGEYNKALGMYAKATVTKPNFALQHWHRILYAIGCTIGLQKPADWLHQHLAPSMFKLPSNHNLEDWPGLSTNHENK